MTRWFRDMHSKVPVGQIWFLAHISNSVEHTKLHNHGDHYILAKASFDSHAVTTCERLGYDDSSTWLATRVQAAVNVISPSRCAPGPTVRGHIPRQGNALDCALHIIATVAKSVVDCPNTSEAVKQWRLILPILVIAFT